MDRPVVLSLYVNLDPSQFATPPARATAVRAVIDDADRRLRARDGLSHDDRRQLEAAIERARGELERRLARADGAHALAVFACEPADLFETIRLPRPVENRAAIGHSPLVGPMARLERRERWCVALVNRRDARIFRGSPESLREIDQVRDVVFGQHDQGGWSQARYQRGVEKEKDDHLKHTVEVLMQHYKRVPFERLVLGGPRETVADFESKLHPYLAERVAGRIEVDVEDSSAEDVLERARPCFEELDEQREQELLERLDGGGRAAVGLEDALEALNERRVEALVLDDRFSAPGTICLECGWVGPAGVTSCPADGSELEQLDDVTEAASELAVQQSADVVAMRHRRDELDERGGIGAVLRF
jgi:peptide chain release factor subunit 1